MKNLLLPLFLLAAFASHAQSEAYRHYSQNPGLDVAFVEGFRLDDSTTVDITLLIAKDSAAFAWLIQEFNLAESYSKAVANLSHLDSNFIITQPVTKANPTQRALNPIEGEYDFMSISLYYKRINIYHTTDRQQRKLIIRKIIQSMSKKHKQQ